MNQLEEIEVKNCPEIKTFDFICDDIIDSDIPRPLPGNKSGWFRMGIIGKSGIGKTNVIRRLTERGGKSRIYCNRFSNAHYISPSIKTMDKNQNYPKTNCIPI